MPKKVHFDNKALMILVPKSIEYKHANVADCIWYSKNEYIKITNDITDDITLIYGLNDTSKATYKKYILDLLK